jgi:CRP-like cAMP-binding protein
MIERMQGPIIAHRDPIWCDVLLRHVRIMHFNPGEIVYREFEKQEYFYIVRSGVLAVEK